MQFSTVAVIRVSPELNPREMLDLEEFALVVVDVEVFMLSTYRPPSDYESDNAVQCV
jgi:hypothetical protein